MGSSTSTMPANVGTSSGVPYGPGLSPQPGFSYRNVWKPLTISFIGNNDLVCNENNPEILDPEWIHFIPDYDYKL